MKRHTGDLASMVVTIPDWKARYHHVSVTYGFDLSKRKMEKKGNEKPGWLCSQSKDRRWNWIFLPKMTKHDESWNLTAFLRLVLETVGWLGRRGTRQSQNQFNQNPEKIVSAEENSSPKDSNQFNDAVHWRAGPCSVYDVWCIQGLVAYFMTKLVVSDLCNDKTSLTEK